jgi:hypothetical protein
MALAIERLTNGVCLAFYFRPDVIPPPRKKG